MSSRFASSGKYTTEQLEAGVDQAAPAEEPDFDPEDKRSLYDRLQAQKDAKQEDFEHRNAFKNQMCVRHAHAHARALKEVHAAHAAHAAHFVSRVRVG